MDTFNRYMNATIFGGAAFILTLWVWEFINNYNFNERPEITGVVALLAVLAVALVIQTQDYR